MEHIDELNWRKSSRSGNGGECVEVAGHDGTVHVRDTKNREGGMLTVSASAWRSFVASVKAE